jgi:hypothetical protein
VAASLRLTVARNLEIWNEKRNTTSNFSSIKFFHLHQKILLDVDDFLSMLQGCKTEKGWIDSAIEKFLRRNLSRP